MAVSGNMISGQAAPAVGRITTLLATVSSAGVDVAFRHLDSPDGVNVAVYLDGEPISILHSLRGDLQKFTIPIVAGNGEHRVDVYPIPVEQKGLPMLRGAPYGRRALLKWPASEDADTRGYLVYQGQSPTGLGDGSPIETIDDTMLLPLWGEEAGNGKISIFGMWTGEPVNELFSIETTGGLYRHDLSGVWADWQPIETGVSVLLDFGIYARFHNAPDVYDGAVGFRVGPSTVWRSQELEEGVWYFALRPFDAAGNVGNVVGPFAMEIIHGPDPVSNLEAVFDPGSTEAVKLSWTIPDPDPDTIEIYTNFSETFGVFENEIIDVPWVTLPGSATQFGFTPGTNGLWSFLVQTRDAHGRRSNSMIYAEVDTTGLKTGILLNEPEQVVAAPGPGGVVGVSWRYLVAGGSDVSEFRIYLNEDPESLDFTTPEAVVAASPLVGPLAIFSWVSDSLDGPRWVTVRAADQDGNETTNEAVINVVPDDQAPSISGDIQGAPG